LAWLDALTETALDTASADEIGSVTLARRDVRLRGAESVGVSGVEFSSTSSPLWVMSTFNATKRCCVMRAG
jgi:hypothetical protein